MRSACEESCIPVILDPRTSSEEGGSIVNAIGAHRLCPSCGAASTIQDSESLWPADWECRACGYAPRKIKGVICLEPALDEEPEGFELESFDLLAEIEASHFWFIARNELIQWLVQRYAADARRVLEIGCGTGFALYALRQALPHALIAGSDLHSRGLAIANRRHGAAVELIQMDARNGGIVGAIDLVGAFDVIEHIADDVAVLREIARMLKPEGILIATVPQHPWLWSNSDDLGHHQRRYQLRELARKAAAAGLEPTYHSSFMTLSLPLMVAARVLPRARTVPRSLEEQINAEFRLSPAKNKALLILARAEHVMRRTGIPLPVGGSQVLVARRRS